VPGEENLLLSKIALAMELLLNFVVISQVSSLDEGFEE
jgi:hypothetical protein